MPETSVRQTQSTSAGWASWAVRNLVFPVWVKRDHPTFTHYYKEFLRTQFLSKSELEKLQLEHLRKLLQYAAENCPFYARRFREAGLDSMGGITLEQFSRLPALTKRDIQDFGPEMLSSGFPAEKRVRNQTGGSTGSPLQFYVDRERFDSRKASTLRHNLWAGIRPGDWQLSLWGSRLDQGRPTTAWDHLRNRMLYRTIALNTSKIEEADWEKLVQEVRSLKPQSMVSYTQSAVLFAQYLRANNIEDIQIPSIVTTAEMLLFGQREYLEQTFRGKVFNRYGCREVSVVASECEFHRGMHVNGDTLLVEIAPDPQGKTKAGRLLITDLLNYSMPLIRYEIGDVGQWAENQECPCGRSLPLLGDIQGRITDFLVLSDGRQISGPALTLVVSDMADVRQVQFVQRSPAQILLRVVPGINYGLGTAQELRKRVGLYLGSAASLQIELTESIASEVSGKYRFVIQENVSPEMQFKAAASSEASHARN